MMGNMGLPDFPTASGIVCMQIVEQLGEPALIALYQYWTEKCEARRAPRRADIDPVDIPDLLPYISLTDVLDGGARYRIRLAGTKVEERFGCSLTNRMFDEVMHGPYLDYVQGLFKKLLRDCAPLYSESSFAPRRTHELRVKRLALPLSDDQKTVNMILCGMIYVADRPNDRSTVLRSLNHFMPPAN